MGVGLISTSLTGGTVRLSAVGRISDGGDGDGNDITAPKLVLAGVGGIGSAGDPLDISSDTIEGSVGSLGAWVRNTRGLTIGDTSVEGTSAWPRRAAAPSTLPRRAP